MDKINYNFVEGSMLELCENVPHLGETNHPVMNKKREEASDHKSHTEDKRIPSFHDLEHRLDPPRN